MDSLALLSVNVIWQIASLTMLSLGLAIVFGLLRVMNMAHGEFVMIGAYAPVITNQLGLSPWLQIPVCIISVAMIATLCERLLIRHLYDRLFDSLLATWGLSILLREAVELVFGRSYQSVSSPLPGTWQIGSLEYPAYRLVVLVLIVLGLTALVLWYRRSLAGVRIRAMIDNPELARSAAIPTQRLSAITFVVGCTFAGLAGLMIAPMVRVEPMMGLDYLLRSFFALVVGGLGTLEGLMVGAGVIAGVQTGVSTLLDQTSGYLTILVISIGFLWLRPNGITGRR